MILRDHGRKPNDVLYGKLIGGYKYKMSNIQAAVGLAQIERINELIKKKRKYLIGILMLLKIATT